VLPVPQRPGVSGDQEAKIMTDEPSEEFTITVSKQTYLRLLMLREQLKEVDGQVSMDDIIAYLIAYEAGEVR